MKLNHPHVTRDFPVDQLQDMSGTPKAANSPRKPDVAKARELVQAKSACEPAYESPAGDSAADSAVAPGKLAGHQHAIRTSFVGKPIRRFFIQKGTSY